MFDSVNFSMQRGEFVVIDRPQRLRHDHHPDTRWPGPESASEGDVFMDGREVAGPSLERGVVFQGHALMPWLSVRKNIAFAVRSKWPNGRPRR